LFAQAKNVEDLSEANFIRPALEINMREFSHTLPRNHADFEGKDTYPAATFHADLRTAVPKVASIAKLFPESRPR
jgi:hypothetical protein